VRRFPDGVHPLPGAVEVLEAIRGSGRPLAIFSNGSHMTPGRLARALRARAVLVSDEEMVTPVRSALSYLRRRHAGTPVLLFAQSSVADLLAREGVDVIVPGDGDVAARPPGAVLVLHVDETTIPELEQA